MRRLTVGVTSLLFLAWGTAHAAGLDADAAHAGFIEAFNTRDWSALREVLADDAVFHRANAEEVFVGADQVLDIFKGTIGAPDQWNVKFARLDSNSQFTGKDGRAVERGEFAITAGAADASCYRGSYMMTWAPQGDEWKLQTLAWQDVETDLANCT